MLPEPPISAELDPAGFVAWASPDALLLIDAAGQLVWASAACEALLGYTPEDHLRTNVFEKVHPDDLGYAVGALGEAARKDGVHLPVQIRVAHASGVWVDVEITANTPAVPEPPLLVLALRGVARRAVLPGRRRELEALVQNVARRCAGATWDQANLIVSETATELGSFLHAARVLVYVVEADGETLQAVSEWLRDPSLCGAAPAVGVSDLDWPDKAASLDFVYRPDVSRRAGTLVGGFVARSELSVPLLLDGAPVSHLIVQWDEDGDPYWDDALGVEVQSLLRILSATLRRARWESELHYDSMHDPLTGLVNRRGLIEELSLELAALDVTSTSSVALLYGDLDGFKAINDERGHEAGDRTLRAVAEQIRKNIRPGDLPARVGGDEFVVLCRRVDNPAQLDDIAARIRHAVSHISPSALSHHLDISIGFISTSVRCDPDTFLHAADTAMYHTKRTQRRLQRPTASK